jgi:two-component system, OmpR family, sensor kinase
MRGFHPRRDVRTRLLTIVMAALAVALAAATVGFNVLFARTTFRDANSLLRTRAASELALVSTAGGRLHFVGGRGNAVGDSPTWLFAGGRLVEGRTTNGRAFAAARSMLDSPKHFRNVHDADLRLYAVPGVAHGARVGTLVTAISIAPYEETQRIAFVASLLLASVLLVVVGFAVYFLLKSALGPVVRMTEQASTWSEQDLERRFRLGEPHDELTQLAATLDGLLDRLATSLRHERRFSAELSHELRTPLAKIVAEAELALRRDREPAQYRAALDVVLRNAQQVTRIIEALLAAARQEAAPTRETADAWAVVEGALDAVAPIAIDRGVRLTAQPPESPLRVGVDGDLAERVLQPVIENACRYGRSRVQITVQRNGSTISYLVSDDGPGIAAGERDAIFEPGTRGQAANGAGEGFGLGLALARRLARSAAGEVTAEPNGGGYFIVTLPAA